ncbi:hypothetical protein GCM10028812_16270 [Ancylobacter sonchi]
MPGRKGRLGTGNTRDVIDREARRLKGGFKHPGNFAIIFDEQQTHGRIPAVTSSLASAYMTLSPAVEHPTRSARPTKSAGHAKPGIVPAPDVMCRVPPRHCFRAGAAKYRNPIWRSPQLNPR